MKKNSIRNLSIIFIFSLIATLIIISTAYSLPIGSCIPDHCPQDYYESGVVCNNGVCSVNCSYYSGCETNFTTVYTDSEYLLNLNVPTYSGAVYKDFVIGNFTPTETNKCYRFRQTTPNNFILNSDIDGYYSLNDFDSGIALYWIDDSNFSMWYENQKYYTSGDYCDYTDNPTEGAVWVDSCTDDGDNFDSADSFINTNNIYCAPNKKACDIFNSSYCDSDCYNIKTKLRLSLYVWLDNGKSCNNFNDFANTGWGDPDPEINYVNFSSQTVYMYVDEYNAILNDSFNITCNYVPQCNPADSCCDSSGNFRSNGFVCKNAHDAVCNSAATCSGTAHEDRCTGTSSTCPDNNYDITYNEACDDMVCGNQSCSGSTFQPERTCSSGTCQLNDPYSCPNNLNCLNALSCKKEANSSVDCKSNYSFDNQYKVCYSNESGIPQGMVYDLNGNLISDYDFNYTYNDFNELANIKDKSGNIIAEYLYDANGNRIKKVEYFGNNNETTYYFENFVQIINSSGVFNESYFYYYDKLVGKRNNNGNYVYYHPDQLGSTNIVTNESGDVIENTSYQPYGEIIEGGNSRYLYTGKEKDSSTGLYYYGARYYNPNQKQFIQPDPIIQAVYDPQSLNRYSYVRNNPYRYIDPSGNSPTVVTGLAGLGIGAAVGGLISIGTQYYYTGQVSWTDVGNSAAIGAVAGGVAGLTLGLGNLAIGAAGLSGASATMAEGGVTVGSSVLSGQVARGTSNILEGKSIISGLGEPSDISIDAGIGLATFGIGKAYQSSYIKNSWFNPRSGETPNEALEYHYNKHVIESGKKMSELQYTIKSQNLFERYLNKDLPENTKIRDVFLRDNSPGFKIDTTNEMGIYNMEGKTVSYHGD